MLLSEGFYLLSSPLSPRYRAEVDSPPIPSIVFDIKKWIFLITSTLKSFFFPFALFVYNSEALPKTGSGLNERRTFCLYVSVSVSFPFLRNSQAV